MRCDLEVEAEFRHFPEVQINVLLARDLLDPGRRIVTLARLCLCKACDVDTPSTRLKDLEPHNHCTLIIPINASLFFQPLFS